MNVHNKLQLRRTQFDAFQALVLKAQPLYTLITCLKRFLSETQIGGDHCMLAANDNNNSTSNLIFISLSWQFFMHRICDVGMLDPINSSQLLLWKIIKNLFTVELTYLGVLCEKLNGRKGMEWNQKKLFKA